MRNHHPAPRAPLGCGGAVGLGAAAALLITVIAIGHAVLGQAEGAARVVITFAEIAVCTLLGALALAAVAALAFGAQFARIRLAVMRSELAERSVMRAEVISGEGTTVRAVPQDTAPAIQGKRPVSAIPGRLSVVPWDREGAELGEGETP